MTIEIKKSQTEGVGVFSDTMCVWYMDVFSQLLDKIINLRNSYCDMILSGCNTQSLFCGMIVSDWGLYEDGVIRNELSECERNCLSVWTDNGQPRVSCSFSLVALEEDIVKEHV